MDESDAACRCSPRGRGPTGQSVIGGDRRPGRIWRAESEGARRRPSDRSSPAASANVPLEPDGGIWREPALAERGSDQPRLAIPVVKRRHRPAATAAPRPPHHSPDPDERRLQSLPPTDVRSPERSSSGCRETECASTEVLRQDTYSTFWRTVMSELESPGPSPNVKQILLSRHAFGSILAVTIRTRCPGLAPAPN
jgi:hypothetical protein